MEKESSGKIIAVIALVIAVIGLSVGFAAFSTTLNIGTTANVEVGTNEWNVGFAATSSGDMAPLVTSGAQTVYGKTNNANNGVAKLMKYTLYQDTPATISTTEGSRVDYEFYIKNAGHINASLAAVTLGSLSCSYITTGSQRTVESDAQNTGTTVTPTEGTITSSDCATMFNVKVAIGDPATVYPDTLTYNNTINAGDSTKIVVSIVATGTAPTNIPTGDFTVSLGNTTVNYQQAS